MPALDRNTADLPYPLLLRVRRGDRTWTYLADHEAHLRQLAREARDAGLTLDGLVVLGVEVPLPEDL